MAQIPISDQAVQKLAEQARVCGLSLAGYLERIANEGIAVVGRSLEHANGSAKENRPRPEDDWSARFEQTIEAMRRTTSTRLPPGAAVDDSRERIYGGPEDRGA